MTSKIVIGLISLILFGLGGLTHSYLNPPKPSEPIYVPYEVPVEAPAEVVKWKTKRITNDRIVDKPVYLAEPRLFKDKAELSEWLKVEYTPFLEANQKAENICVDMVIAWQIWGLAHGGYLISGEMTIDGDAGHIRPGAWTQDGYFYVWDVTSTYLKLYAQRGDNP